ncbi:unnamed protein product [Urochloa humidicola]
MTALQPCAQRTRKIIEPPPPFGVRTSLTHPFASHARLVPETSTLSRALLHPSCNFLFAGFLMVERSHGDAAGVVPGALTLASNWATHSGAFMKLEFHRDGILHKLDGCYDDNHGVGKNWFNHGRDITSILDITAELCIMRTLHSKI